jgi:hypothetical protein
MPEEQCRLAYHQTRQAPFRTKTLLPAPDTCFHSFIFSGLNPNLALPSTGAGRFGMKERLCRFGYVRRNKRGESFKEVEDVGRSLAQDRRKAKTVAKRGQGDQGDRSR